MDLFLSSGKYFCSAMQRSKKKLNTSTQNWRTSQIIYLRIDRKYKDYTIKFSSSGLLPSSRETFV